MSKWRKKLYAVVGSHIERDIRHDLVEMFVTWWHMTGEKILNEFEEVLDEEKELARGEALREACVAIHEDANIDNNDVNVSRVLHHLKTLEAETGQEVDYENPSREDLEREFPAPEGVDK